jgi:hypothetical protein
MALQVTCTCGYVFGGADEDELWAKASAHLKEVHPEMVGAVSREDIVGQAEQI